MIRDLLAGQFSQFELMMALLSIPVVLFSLSLHEAAHGYAAEKMGDPTARYLGRITLNPLRHLDPLGTVAMLLVGFGWAKPVPVNPRNFRHPRKGMALTGLAGPVSNLLFGFVSLLAFRIMGAVTNLSVFLEKGTLWCYAGASLSFPDILALLFYVAAVMNVTLAIFNLIPVPPFDGSRIFYFLLPDKYYFGVMRYERQIMMVAFLLLATGVLSPIISFLSDAVLSGFDFLLGLVPFL